jgi:hypothetical protein
LLSGWGRIFSAPSLKATTNPKGKTMFEIKAETPKEKETFGYLVQDSDWLWDDAEGGATYVTATNPQEAATKAIKMWITAGFDFDGACVKVQRIIFDDSVNMEVFIGEFNSEKEWVWDKKETNND